MDKLHFTKEELNRVIKTSETCSKNEELRFTEMIANKVAESLRISYGFRGTFINMLVSALEPFLVKGRDHLLEQYLHTQLDTMVNRFQSTFDLSEEEAVVDYGHASHAKFATIMEAIKKKMPNKEKKGLKKRS